MNALEALGDKLRGYAMRLRPELKVVENEEPEEKSDDEVMNDQLARLVNGPHYEGLHRLLSQGVENLDAMMENAFGDTLNRLVGRRQSLRDLLDELDNLKE